MFSLNGYSILKESNPYGFTSVSLFMTEMVSLCIKVTVSTRNSDLGSLRAQSQSSLAVDSGYRFYRLPDRF